MTDDTGGARRRHPSRQRGPTKAPAISRRWPERRGLALLIRSVVFVVPLLASFLVAFWLSRELFEPVGFWARVGRWFVIAIVATAAMIVVQRLLRRLLPLAALLSLTLVFPDETPSRFGVALRGMSARRLEHRLAEVERDGWGDTTREEAATLLTLVAALSRHDRLTRGHSERVRAYSVMIGEEMGLEDVELDRLRWAALVHDVGKLAVPAEILTKPDSLTTEEFELVRGHPGAGRRLVAPLVGWLGPAADAVYEHHERFEGGGYPTGVPSERLALTSRIVSVADAFDVMTSARSYKQPMPASAARAELQRCAGTQFDPEVVRAMLNISLGRLWRAMGPLSWLAQLGLFPRAGAQVGPAVNAGVSALLSMVFAGIAALSGGGSTPQEFAVAVEPPVTAQPDEEIVIESGAVPSTTSNAAPSTTSPASATPGTSPSPPTTTLVPGPIPSTSQAPSPPIVVQLPVSSSLRRPVDGTFAPSIVTTPPRSVGAVTSTTSVPSAAPPGRPPTGTSPPVVTSPSVTVPTTTPPAGATTTTTPTTPTTPTTTPPPTGTTVPPSGPPPTGFVLVAASSGNQPAQPVIDLVDGRAGLQHLELPNYDVDRNDDPGLTLIGTPGGLTSQNPAGVQVWRLPATVDRIEAAALTLYLAPLGPPQPGQIKVQAGIFDCDADRSSCAMVSFDDVRYVAEDETFVPVRFELGVTPQYIVAPGRRLELRFATLNGSNNDVLVGYDAVPTPSRLELS